MPTADELQVAALAAAGYWNQPPPPTGDQIQVAALAAAGYWGQPTAAPTAPVYTPAPPASKGPDTPSTGTTQADSSAKALINGTLGTYGLGSLADWAWAKWQNGESVDQIMLELRATPEYAARFPAMDQLSKSGHAITESQYINYESSVSQIFKAAGLPATFYDQPADFASFLTNNIALPELQQRVQDYQQVAFSAPQEVRDQLQNLYGVSPGDLTAFFIDPDKALPIITQKFNAAAAAGYSNLSGFGQLTQAQAEMVGNKGLSDTQLSQQFGQLSQLNPLFNPLQGTTETGIGTDVALGAAFNQNAQDQAAIAQRKAQRLADYQGGGQVGTTTAGAVGAGTAR